MLYTWVEQLCRSVPPPSSLEVDDKFACASYASCIYLPLIVVIVVAENSHCYVPIGLLIHYHRGNNHMGLKELGGHNGNYLSS
jgi:hypothetical protein